MTSLHHTARASWSGDLRGGNGQMTADSGAFSEVLYSFSTRFENQPGSNPEELIAAAHAACYSMAFAGVLARAGYNPEQISTEATCTVESKPEGGFRISRMRLVTRGRVSGIDAETFKELARQGEQSCPVSNLLRCGLEIELDADLESA